MREPKSSIRYAGRAAAVVATIGVIAAAACSSESTGVAGTTQAQLAFSASASASGDAAAIAPVTNGGHTLNLTGVTLTIARAELKRTTADSCADDNDDNDNGDDHGGSGQGGDNNSGRGNNSGPGNCSELKVGPTTIDVPLTGNVVTVPADVIPAGTFRELELRVSQVELKGTFDTTTFDVKIPIDARAEIEFATPLVVTAGQPTSITVNVPVGNILVNTDSTLINPTKILTTPSLLSLVRSRILASFHAFEDEDHDGHDDHGGHGNGGGPGRG